MRIMGLRDRVLYTSWWLTALIQFALITTLCTAVIKIFVVHTAGWIIFLYVGLFCLSKVHRRTLAKEDRVLSLEDASFGFMHSQGLCVAKSGGGAEQ